MSDPTLPSFRYRLEQKPPRTDYGGVVRAASVRQFPVSKGLAGASMRLQLGCLRELHWHPTAAELGYVVSGSCRTTVLSPDGADTGTFRPGDVWCFPRGWGHSIRGIGSSECHFISRQGRGQRGALTRSRSPVNARRDSHRRHRSGACPRCRYLGCRDAHLFDVAGHPHLSGPGGCTSTETEWQGVTTGRDNRGNEWTTSHWNGLETTTTKHHER